MIGRIIQFIGFLITYIPIWIYNKLYSKHFTTASYQKMAERFCHFQSMGKVLDVGVGTGHPLYQIIDDFPKTAQIKGIDIDRTYLESCRDLFKEKKNVEIREMNYYNLEKSSEKYDLIIFSSSFMILPDRVKALDIAKQHLAENGKIFFLMTLFKERGILQSLVGYIKPYLKYIMTIEMGEIIYEDYFIGLMEQGKMKITSKEILNESIFHKLVNMNVVEVVRANVIQE